MGASAVPGAQSAMEPRLPRLAPLSRAGAPPQPPRLPKWRRPRDSEAQAPAPPHLPPGATARRAQLGQRLAAHMDSAAEGHFIGASHPHQHLGTHSAKHLVLWGLEYWGPSSRALGLGCEGQGPPAGGRGALWGRAHSWGQPRSAAALEGVRAAGPPGGCRAGAGVPHRGPWPCGGRVPAPGGGQPGGWLSRGALTPGRGCRRRLRAPGTWRLPTCFGDCWAVPRDRRTCISLSGRSRSEQPLAPDGPRPAWEGRASTPVSFIPCGVQETRLPESVRARSGKGRSSGSGAGGGCQVGTGGGVRGARPQLPTRKTRVNQRRLGLEGPKRTRGFTVGKAAATVPRPRDTRRFRRGPEQATRQTRAEATCAHGAAGSELDFAGPGSFQGTARGAASGSHRPRPAGTWARPGGGHRVGHAASAL